MGNVEKLKVNSIFYLNMMLLVIMYTEQFCTAPPFFVWYFVLSKAAVTSFPSLTVLSPSSTATGLVVKAAILFIVLSWILGSCLLSSSRPHRNHRQLSRQKVLPTPFSPIRTVWRRESKTQDFKMRKTYRWMLLALTADNHRTS